MDATIIYPHQLFENHPALAKDRLVFLVEDELFFKQYPFHKQKLVFHRSTMKNFADSLTSRGYDVVYIQSANDQIGGDLVDKLKTLTIKKIHLCEVDDDWLSRKIIKLVAELSIDLKLYETPGFLTPISWSKEYYSEGQSYFQTSFYIEQRKRLGILIGKDGKPTGGKWTFDSENRKKLPKIFSLPKEPTENINKYTSEAKLFINSNYPKNPGSIDFFFYPTSHKEARIFLKDFISYKLSNFGTYQDALTVRSKFLFHSILSPLINVGLLTPNEVLQGVLDYVDHLNVEINSVEGFVRQIIGWREFFRVIYRLESKNQRTSNFFSIERKIPGSFWNASTGITPVDSVIEKVLDTAYAHHIERLMVLGNFMLLCEFHPNQVYEWFMTFFIDSYDWVMVPNVYGMSQFSDGGVITTKPYVSSSNYIKKMSDYPDGDWNKIWDGLYWRFISKNQRYLKKNRRMNMMVTQLEKMEPTKIKTHLKIAGQYLESLT